jgi:hypothetical protein
MIWHTMESAPMDGTPVLLKGGYYIDELFSPPDFRMLNPMVARIVTFKPNYYHWLKETMQVWLIVANEGGDYLICYENPTHWAELPV